MKRHLRFLSICSPEVAFGILRPLCQLEVEEFWALALSADKRLLGMQMLFRGTVDSCTIHPRDVFRFAIVHNASSVLVAHNHPSQDDLPSEGDISITKTLVLLGKALELPLVDHLILTAKSYRSLATEDWFQSLLR